MIDLRQFQTGLGKTVDIFRFLEAAVLDGRLLPGERLPTVRVLADHLGVNKNTVAAAYRMLQDSGMIVTDGRRGSVVAARQTEHNRAPSTMPVVGNAVPLHDGNPDAALLPGAAQIRGSLAALDLTPHLYGDQRNSPRLVEWSKAAFAADQLYTERIFVSGGALDAIERTLRTNLKAGDKVAFEDPAYMTSLALARSLGLRPVGMGIDADGIIPAELEAAVASGCRAVIFSTRAQNPTGIVTTQRRARELRRVAMASGDILFIDDDHSSLLALAPYEAWHSGASRWLTIRSFSKFLGPDLRVAVSAGDAATLGKLDYSQAVGMGWVSTLLQNLAVSLVTDERVRAKIDDAGAIYRHRFTSLMARLREVNINPLGSAGLNMWIPVDDPGKAAQWLLSKGWLVRPGNDFCLRSPPGIRVTCSRLQAEQIDVFSACLRELTVAASNTFSA